MSLIFAASFCLVLFCVEYLDYKLAIILQPSVFHLEEWALENRRRDLRGASRSHGDTVCIVCAPARGTSHQSHLPPGFQLSFVASRTRWVFELLFFPSLLLSAQTGWRAMKTDFTLFVWGRLTLCAKENARSHIFHKIRFKAPWLYQLNFYFLRRVLPSTAATQCWGWRLEIREMVQGFHSKQLSTGTSMPGKHMSPNTL